MESKRYIMIHIHIHCVSLCVCVAYVCRSSQGLLKTSDLVLAQHLRELEKGSVSQRGSGSKFDVETKISNNSINYIKSYQFSKRSRCVFDVSMI